MQSHEEISIDEAKSLFQYFVALFDVDFPMLPLVYEKRYQAKIKRISKTVARKVL